MILKDLLETLVQSDPLTIEYVDNKYGHLRTVSYEHISDIFKEDKNHIGDPLNDIMIASWQVEGANHIVVNYDLFGGKEDEA